MSWQSLSSLASMGMFVSALATSYLVGRGMQGMSLNSALSLFMLGVAVAGVLFGIFAAMSAWKSFARQQSALLFLASTTYAAAYPSLLSPLLTTRLPSLLPLDVALALLAPCLLVTGLLGRRLPPPD
ncbi:hypothetical protein [Sphingomonas arenae]|uniref:hypothetical protein n=1 Tax=Sphingomonas arenae TaxID=2812555 RepID=UPI001966E509|nr:hypothetical protein [Sphingomonas arenae]